MIISKTPLRISFAGGGTDLPSFYREHEFGAVVSTSIDSYIYVTVKEHGELFSEHIRLNYSEVERVERRDDIQNPIIRECMRFLDVDDKLYISTIADTPASSGLGSSSAFCVGLLNALYKYKGVDAARGRLAEEAAHIEMAVLERPIGKQDHYAAAYGGLSYLRFNADGATTIRPLVIPRACLHMLFDGMLSFWTGVTRSSEPLLREQDRRNGTNADLLIAMRDQAARLSSMLGDKDCTLRSVGMLVHEGWQMKRRLTEQVSNERIDQCYEVARRHGAFGGKLSGAGGGGFLNVFVPPECQKKVTQAMAAEGLIPVRFQGDSQGTTVIKLS